MTAHELTVADGRSLEVVEGGAPDGVPVIVHHGTPGAAGLLEDWERDALERGLRLLAHSRPGYGSSTRQPGRTVAAVAADVAAIADALGVERFLTWGVSGGGPHALACAALLPERTVAAASLAGVAPYDGEGLDFFDGMGEGNVEDFARLQEHGREGPRQAAQETADMFRTVDEAGLVDGMSGFITDVDAAELRGGLAGYLLANSRAALRDGVEGWLDDNVVFVEPWGFDPADIRVPVLVWQGRQDAMVPFGHGTWLAGRVPGAEARLTEEDGHLTLMTRRVGEVHGWLLERWTERVGAPAVAAVDG